MAAFAATHLRVRKALDGARKQLSAEELKEADKLAAKLIKDYGPKDDESPDQAKTIEPE